MRTGHLKSRETFIFYFIRNLLWGMLFIVIALFIGMLGYHVFENMLWVDAFVNASMILSGMGPMGALTTNAGKIFAGCYALFSGLTFIVAISVVFAPIVHLFLHKIHLESSAESKRNMD